VAIFGDMGVYSWNNMANLKQDVEDGAIDLVVHMGDHCCTLAAPAPPYALFPLSLSLFPLSFLFLSFSLSSSTLLVKTICWASKTMA
jgi:hypothetical protein